MLTTPAFVVCSIEPINDTTIVVNYEMREEAYTELPTANVAVASFVTAQARLRLYDELEKLEDRVLYYDTDSIIYVSRNGEYEVPTGKCIGDMTNELEIYGLGSYINEFVSGGPKNYAYKVWSTKASEEKIVCKVKGITLNYSALQTINFGAMKRMVTQPSKPIPILSNNIRRNAVHEVLTVRERKLYRPYSKKRKFMTDYSSVPYGYKIKKL